MLGWAGTAVTAVGATCEQVRGQSDGSSVAHGAAPLTLESLRVAGRLRGGHATSRMITHSCAHCLPPIPEHALPSQAVPLGTPPDHHGLRTWSAGIGW